MTEAPKLNPDLLNILRCPIAVHEIKEPDPGKLTVVADGWWLHCEDTGCNYPIQHGIPNMLPEVGQKWRHVDITTLPVPPPQEEE